MKYEVEILHSPNPTFTKVSVHREDNRWFVQANTEGSTYSEPFATEQLALQHLAELLTQLYLEHCQLDESYAKLVLGGTPPSQVPYVEPVLLAFRIRSPNGIVHTLYHGHGLESTKGTDSWWANENYPGTFVECLKHILFQ